MKAIEKLLLSVFICEAVGIVSTPFTLSAIPTWYNFLIKPPIAPPNWIFGPVWTMLYFLMGVSVFLIWQKGFKKKQNKNALLFFGIQLLLNFFWSLIFFGLRSPLLGFIEIVFLWFFILFTIMKFYKISKIAAYLLVPYFCWVTFAGILNASIAYLNF